MTNRLMVAAAAVVVLGSLLLTPVAFGQDVGGRTPPTPPNPSAPPTTPPPAREAGPTKPNPGPSGGQVGIIKDTLAKLNLTDAQNQQINDLLAKFQADLKAGSDKNADALKQIETDMKAAREDGDKAKMKDLQTQRAKLTPDMRAKIEELVKQITPILTDDQAKQFGPLLKEAFQKPAGPPPPGAVVERILRDGDKLKLTDDQKTAIQNLLKAYQDAMKNAQAAQGPDGEKTRKDLGAKLLADVKADLTADQVALAEKMFQPPPPPRDGGLDKALAQLNLTDDQKAKIADLQKAMQDAMKNAQTKDDRRALEQKFMQDLGNVLTADQKDQLQKITKAGRDNPPPPPPGDRPKGPGPGGDRPNGNPPGGGQPPAGPPPL